MVFIFFIKMRLLCNSCRLRLFYRFYSKKCVFLWIPKKYTFFCRKAVESGNLHESHTKITAFLWRKWKPKFLIISYRQALERSNPLFYQTVAITCMQLSPLHHINIPKEHGLHPNKNEKFSTFGHYKVPICLYQLQNCNNNNIN